MTKPPPSIPGSTQAASAGPRLKTLPAITPGSDRGMMMRGSVRQGDAPRSSLAASSLSLIRQIGITMGGSRVTTIPNSIATSE